MILQPDTKSTYYKAFNNRWQKIGAICEGEETIKDMGDLYLPKLSGQTAKEYDAYRNRGTFFNAFLRTVTGLVGAIIRKEPVIKTHASIDKLLGGITLYNESIQEVIKVCLTNILEFGYYGILIDMPIEQSENNNPYFALYAPSSILNLKTERLGSDYKLTLLSLLEVESVPDPDNPFADSSIERIRVLSIEDGVLVIRLYKKNSVSAVKGKEEWVQDGEDILPRIRGKNATEIPFVFLGSLSNTPIPDPPPLMDLANLNIKHWQLTVDYYHGLHYCAIPTPWAAGFGKGTDLYIGANRAWVSDDPNAKCGYLEFTGSGLSAVLAAIDKLENQMAIIGARMLEEQKKAAEAADTVRMRYSGDTATLSGVVGCIEQGIMKAIDWLGIWLGIEAKT
ncbi:MAG: DUF4055 domain-containing protein, partial [Candidatus Paceibacterota bacterium]